MSDTTPFGTMLQSLLRRHKWTQARFAKKVKRSAACISAIKNGRQAPPTDDLEQWADMLKLAGSERDRFIDLGLAEGMQGIARERFRRLVEEAEQVHLLEVRGSLVLADHVYQDRRTDKWIVAGTYARWWTSKDKLHCPDLAFYLRLQVERPGLYPCKLWAVDVSASPTAPKLWEQRFKLQIDESALPVYENSLILPGPVIPAPKPFSERRAGEAFALRTMIWLRVGKIEVASCPLDFIFCGPPPTGDHDDRPRLPGPRDQ